MTPTKWVYLHIIHAAVVSSPFTDGSEAHGVVGTNAPSDLDDEFSSLVLTGQARKARASTVVGAQERTGAGPGGGRRVGGVPANLQGFVDEAGSEEEDDHPQSLSFGNWG